MTTFIGAIVSVLGINGITQFYKSVQAKYTDNEIHIAAFILAVVASIIWAYAQSNSSFMLLLEHIAALGLSAVGMYEVAWKKIGAVVNTPSSGAGTVAQ